MRIGYARVSRRDQRLGPQRDALLADGCERVFEEKISSRKAGVDPPPVLGRTPRGKVRQQA